jgi:hypothetical protein
VAIFDRDVPAYKRFMKHSARNMCKQAGSRILFLLLVLGTPLIVCAQSQEPRARFSVEPSDPGTPYGVGIQGEPFKFTADVTGAKCYEFGFGDDPETREEVLPGDNGKGVHIHNYKDAGTYYAKLQAWSDRDCELGEPPPVFTLEIHVKLPAPAPQPRTIVLVQPPPPAVTVQAPPPAVAEQWPPPARPVATVPPAPEKSDTLPWLLLLAAIAILLSRDWGLTGTGLVTFEATRDRGGFEVIGAAVSMRVRHRKPEFEISDDAAVISVKKGEL